MAASIPDTTQIMHPTLNQDLPRQSDSSRNPTLNVAIIGAGFSGLAMARGLQRTGIDDFRIFEKAGAIGGTWRDNVYPGAACDVPSHLYSLSDAAHAGWSRLFPAQAEILDYLCELAAPFQSAGKITFGAELTRATWQEDAASWALEFRDGSTTCARHLVLGLGGLHQPAYAEIPGRDDFAGVSMHTARWRPDIDLAGKRVAVIGTGASAVQVIPELVKQVANLYVCQRSPGWVLPRPDLMIPTWLQRGFAVVPALRLALRGGIFLWLEAISLGLRRPAWAFWARALGRRHLRRQIRDPALRARLRAVFPIGCKRVLISSDYYPALAQPHCTLVDTPIARIEPSGIRLTDGRLLAVDAIVHATGFRPLDVLRDLEIVGRGGRRLAEDWSERPRAHLGIGVHGYPNLSFLLGPNTALGHNSVLYMIESQVRHVLALMRHARNRGARSVEPTAEAQAAFIDMLDRRFVGTAWAGGCRSWYLDAQGRNIALWVGSAMAYRRLTRRPRPNEYLFS